MTFDMRDAREIAEKCNSKDESIDHDYWNAHAGMFLPTALDEIEYWKSGAMQGQDTHEKVAAVLGKTDAPWVLARDMKKENEMLHGQIATLKSICIQERNRYLVDFVHEYDDVMDCKEEAKKQLAREYPEIAWDEKK